MTTAKHEEKKETVTETIEKRVETLKNETERMVFAGIGLADLARERVEKIFGDLVKRGEKSTEGKKLEEVFGKLNEKGEKLQESFKSLLSREDRDEISALNAKIDELTDLVQKLQATKKAN